MSIPREHWDEPIWSERARRGFVSIAFWCGVTIGIGIGGAVAIIAEAIK